MERGSEGGKGREGREGSDGGIYSWILDFGGFGCLRRCVSLHGDGNSS